MSDFTLKDLEKIIQALYPEMWYHIDDRVCKRGTVIKVKKGKWNPEYYIFNSEDFAEHGQKLREKFTLKDVKGYKPDYSEMIKEIRYVYFVD